MSVGIVTLLLFTVSPFITGTETSAVKLLRNNTPRIIKVLMVVEREVDEVIFKCWKIR